MPIELNREQMTMIIERARHQRSIATGDLFASATHRTFSWLHRWANKAAHAITVSPTPHH